MSREAPPTLPGQLAAVMAASGLALAVQVPFFRSIGTAVPASLIALNGVVILIFCLIAAFIARRKRATWSAILFVSPGVFALLPVVERNTHSQALWVAAGIILVASIVVSRLSREGGAPLIAAGTGLRAVMGKLVSAEIFWAHNFSNLDTTNEKTIQDNGIHFQLSIGWPK